MKNELCGKDILITGGTGSIGSEIVRQILNYEVNKVIIFSKDELRHLSIKKRIPDDRLEAFVGDVRDYNSIRRIFEQENIDIVYHAAAMKHVIVCEKFPIESVKTNIIGTQNLVDLARAYEVPKMITISTDKSACPVNVMGSTKFIAERITLNSNYSCVRFGNVANSRGSVIPIFIQSLINKTPIEITDPDVTRFIISISDAANLVLKATKYSNGGEIFILKMKAFKLGDLLDVVIDRIAPILNIREGDVIVNRTSLALGEKLHEDLVNFTELGRLYELDDMYLILENIDFNANNTSFYEKLTKSEITKYTSNEVELLSKDELEIIIRDYLNTSTSLV